MLLQAPEQQRCCSESCHVRKLAYLSIADKKINKLLNDMAKVRIKSEKLTPFGGIFSIMDPLLRVDSCFAFASTCFTTLLIADNCIAQKCERLLGTHCPRSGQWMPSVCSVDAHLMGNGCPSFGLIWNSRLTGMQDTLS